MAEIAKLCLNLLPVKFSRENCTLFSGHGTCMYIGVRLNGSRTSAFLPLRSGIREVGRVPNGVRLASGQPPVEIYDTKISAGDWPTCPMTRRAPIDVRPTSFGCVSDARRPEKF